MGLDLNRDDIIEAYRASHAVHGDSPSAVMWPRGRQELRFRALTRHFDASTPYTILDYGCGLAHLHDYLIAHGHQAAYIGADIVPEFVEASGQKYPGSSFFLIKGDGDVGIEVDHVVVSGTFNIIEGDRQVHWDTVRGALVRLFKQCRSSLAVNFMTDQVDFQQDEAFHVSPAEVVEFVRRSLSRRYTLDHSYMPYEFTVVTYKDDRILRPSNVFEHAEG